MPSMTNEQEYYGKYVAIEKEVASLEKEGYEKGMVDEREEGKEKGKRLRYLYIEKNFKLC